MGIKKHGGSIGILTSSLPVRIPIRIPPSYGHLGQQIDLLRETEFDSFYHLLKKILSLYIEEDTYMRFGHHFLIRIFPYKIKKTVI